MSGRTQKRLVWTLVYAILVGGLVFDLVMTHSGRGYVSLSRVGAGQINQPMVALSTSQDLAPAIALDDSNLTYEQVKELVYLALDRDVSAGNLSSTIDADDWVAIKVNMVVAPLIVGGVKKSSFWKGLIGGVPYQIGEPHWGAVSDLRVTKALIAYLIERVGPQRITIIEGSGEIVTTGSPYFASYDIDGWTVTWDEFDGLSYQGIVDAFNAAQSETTLDIVDLNDDGYVLRPVPGGGLQLLGGSKRNWGYEDFIPGFGTPRESWYVPNTLVTCDKLIDQATLKTTAPGITVFMKNYVGAVGIRAYGAGPGKGAVIDGVAIMSGYTDLVRIRPPDYCLAAGFWSSDGWYGGTYDINHNVVIAGQNVVAAEAVAARVMGYNPHDLQQMHLARDVGLGSFEKHHYEVVGPDPSSLLYRFPGNSNFRPSGFQEFVMLGPFEEDDIDVDLLGGESAVSGVLGEQAGGQTWWAYAHRPGYPEPYTDFSHLSLGDINSKTVYAFVDVQSDVAQDGYLRFGSDGPARVWLNGVQVLDAASAGPYAHQAPVVHLEEGSNSVLVKSVGTVSGAGFALSITDGDRMLVDIHPVAPGVHLVPEFTVPLSPGFNLVGLGGSSAHDSIATVVEAIESNLIRVLGFETTAVNPNPPVAGAKLYDPSLPDFVNTLCLTDYRLAYWLMMSAADTLITGGGPAKPVAMAAAGAGRLYPVRDFMGIHGQLQVDGEPAPVGTLVEVVDGQGALAGRFQVHHAGYYGFLPLYRDDPDSPLDEGADTGEWLTVHVDGQPTSQRVQWTEFGDVVQLDMEATSWLGSLLPTASVLGHNYPNPFNPSTTISYQLAQEEEVVLSIWNLAGQLIRDLVHAPQPAGHHSVTWDGTDGSGRLVANGVYVYRIRAGAFQSAQKMVLAK